MTVRDFGVGLSPAEAQHVFDRFWRADPSRVRTVGGSGLGLSISLEDARLHGGWLQVWGQPGAGAQFRLTLPLAAGGDLTGSPLPLRPAVLRPPSRDADVMPSARGAGGAPRPCCPAVAGLLDGAAGDSPTVQITQAPERPAEEVGIEPLPPEPGATPEEIVRGFIDAAASSLAGPPGRPRVPHRARPPRRGRDEGGITIISPDYRDASPRRRAGRG